MHWERTSTLFLIKKNVFSAPVATSSAKAMLSYWDRTFKYAVANCWKEKLNKRVVKIVKINFIYPKTNTY
jgi:hypothetical protein